MEGITKYLKYISLFIGVLGIVFFIRLVMNGDGEGLDSIVGGFLAIAKWVLIITVILVLIFSVINLLKNPKALKKAIISIVVLGVLFLIAYMIADDGEVVTKAVTVAKGGESKLIEGGLWFSVILGAIAFFGFIFDAVRNIIKN